MKKNGFTLIELVAVLVILSLLILFVFPNVINVIKKGKNEAKKLNETIIIEAAKDYFKENNVTCVNVSNLKLEKSVIDEYENYSVNNSYILSNTLCSN